MTAGGVKLKQLPQSSRPRERLCRLGASGLSDVELLAVLLRTGTAARGVLELAGSLLAEFGGLRAMAQASPSELVQSIGGMGEAKAAALLAAFELGRRSSNEQEGLPPLKAWLADWACQLRPEAREFVVAGFFDDQDRLLGDERLSYGGPDGAALDMPYLLRRAVRLDCRGVALLHNHPDGVSEPSMEDRKLTDYLACRLELLNIRFIGHFLIVGGRVSVVSGSSRRDER